MITTEQKQEFKVRLEKERDLLQQELSTLGTQNPSNKNDWEVKKPEGEEFGADRNDNADIVEAMQENNAALNELEGRLNLVLEALAKFDAGTYGVCEVSGEPIEIERLNANPAARTCMQHMND
jgi:RNA polymerase-binding transcription factor DksA